MDEQVLAVHRSVGGRPALRTALHRATRMTGRRVLLRVAAGTVAVLAIASLGPSPGPTSGPGATNLRTTAASPAVGVDGRHLRSFPRFGEVTVTGAFEVDGAGRNVDTIAFWQAPKASRSLMFVTSKDRSLVEVWRYPFSSGASERAPLRHRCLTANPDSATNGVVVDQRSDLLYVASSSSPNVCVFSLPDLAYRSTIRAGTSYGPEPNLALLRSRSGLRRLYVSDDSVVHVLRAGTGRELSRFLPGHEVETMWGDQERHLLYVPDEGGRTGVYAYRPDGTPYSQGGRHKLGSPRIFDADAEGIVGLTCPPTRRGPSGKGLIVVSDQIDSPASGNDYEVFDRRSWRHLGTIRLRLPGGSGYVVNTDGIGSLRQSSARYRGGLFAAVHDDRSVVGVAWSTVFRAISRRTGSPFGCGGGGRR